VRHTDIWSVLWKSHNTGHQLKFRVNWYTRIKYRRPLYWGGVFEWRECVCKCVSWSQRYRAQRYRVLYRQKFATFTACELFNLTYILGWNCRKLLTIQYLPNGRPTIRRTGAVALIHCCFPFRKMDHRWSVVNTECMVHDRLQCCLS